MREKLNAMEKTLSERSSVFSSGYNTNTVSSSDLISVLTETDVIVDMVRIRSFDQDFKDESRYVAFILKKGSGIDMVELENGNQLETRYAKYYRTAIQQRVNDEYSYNQFWSTIDPKLVGKKTIYFSPDGVYSQLNLNTLRASTGEYNVNRYDVVVVGNARDLLRDKVKASGATKRGAFLLGFPDYATHDVAALPGTKIEIENISKVLKGANYTVTTRLQKEANEKNIKNLNAPLIVHIATHGYFLQDIEGAVGSVYGIDAENASNNPLLRSGLILADAKNAISGVTDTNISETENGILTAYEAMNLDLEGTDLVVLSACETGLGDVKAGEGVYGLQRSFLVAGADALIMSLWKVDDEATQLLMSGFYTNLVKGIGKQKAFKQAQIQLMAKYKDPYYWGAFVMIGM
ncbi:MAG: CHAT domain-containing protein [Flammeovirgaceae bacterium]|nr:CHAT domain-containing protein [Flammeovirgaceae bacterium]